MQPVDPRIGVAAAALGVLTFAACSAPPTPSTPQAVASTDAQSVIAAPHPPPPRRAEIPPPSPSPQALWRFGNWRWDGQQYVWLPGQYMERPSPSANWRPGYWQEAPDGWMWVEGEWT